MRDILEEISKISLIFQKDAISISQVKAEIERASEALENMQDNLEDILLPFKKKLGMEQCSRGSVLPLECLYDILSTSWPFLPQVPVWWTEYVKT